MRTRHVVVVGLAVLLAVGPAAAQAADVAGKQAEEACECVERGERQFRRRNWEQALAEFEKAFAINPGPALRYHIGLCRLELERPMEARAELVRFLEEMDPERIGDGERRAVDEALARIDRQLGLLELRVNVEGATFLVDGEEVGAAPLSEPVRVLPGDHEVEARAEGHAPMAIPVTVGEGERQSLQLVLVPEAVEETEPEPEPVAPPPPVEAPEAGDDGGLSPVWFWVSIGATGALAAGTAISGAMLADRVASYDRAAGWCEDGWNDACREGETIADEGEALDIATLTLVCATGAAAFTALMLGLFTDFDGEASETPPLTIGATPVPDAGGEIGGLVLGAVGTF